MKKIIAFLLVMIELLTLSSCFERGPYPAPINQQYENVVRIDLLNGQKEDAVFGRSDYADAVIYTLEPEEFLNFMEGLSKVTFYTPMLDPSRHLGDIAVKIYYADGKADLIGENCNYYLDSDNKFLKRELYYPDEDPFYALFEQYVYWKLLPRRY